MATIAPVPAQTLGWLGKVSFVVVAATHAVSAAQPFARKLVRLGKEFAVLERRNGLAQQVGWSFEEWIAHGKGMSAPARQVEGGRREGHGVSVLPRPEGGSSVQSVV